MGSQSPQSTQRPKSIRTGDRLIAELGQSVWQAEQPASHSWWEMTGLARKPTGLAVRNTGMYWEPWDFLTDKVFLMILSYKSLPQ